MPLLMPELQSALVDPLPEVRATAAHALGSLLRGMGEQHFQGLMPWLLATLNSEVRTNRTAVHPMADARVLACTWSPPSSHRVRSCQNGLAALWGEHSRAVVCRAEKQCGALRRRAGPG